MKKITLKEARAKAKLTQKQLSDMTGIPFRTIQDLEADKVMHLSIVRADYLFKLSKVLEVSMEELSGCTCYEIWEVYPTQEDILELSFSKESAIDTARYYLKRGWKENEIEIRYNTENIEEYGYDILDFPIEDDDYEE